MNFSNLLCLRPPVEIFVFKLASSYEIYYFRAITRQRVRRTAFLGRRKRSVSEIEIFRFARDTNETMELESTAASVTTQAITGNATQAAIEVTTEYTEAVTVAATTEAVTEPPTEPATEPATTAPATTTTVYVQPPSQGSKYL